MSYATNPQLMCETIDGETIIIDLESGSYYSLRGTAGLIWAGLAGGDDLDGIVARVDRVYASEGVELRAAIEAFVRELEERRLIADGGASQVPAATATAVDASAAGGTRLPFESPKLEQFDDMQDIILLDPVHKVDDTGWPHRAAAEVA